jgi:hypothetical protein
MMGEKGLDIKMATVKRMQFGQDVDTIGAKIL